MNTALLFMAQASGLQSLMEFQWTSSFPLSWIKTCFFLFFFLIFILVIRQKKSFVYEGAPDQAKWRDLRLWAGGILIVQTGLYLWL